MAGLAAHTEVGRHLDSLALPLSAELRAERPPVVQVPVAHRIVRMLEGIAHALADADATGSVCVRTARELANPAGRLLVRSDDPCPTVDRCAFKGVGDTDLRQMLGLDHHAEWV